MDIPEPGVIDPVQLEIDRLRAKRDSGTWYAVVGIAMLFMGGFHTGLVIGGVLMVTLGVVTYVFWSRRMHAAYDPWKDKELDDWEKEHFGE